MFLHRPCSNNDIHTICSFPQNITELFYFFPKAIFPLTPEQLQSAIDNRSDSTIIESDGTIVGFANFVRWGDTCNIGNVIIAPFARGKGVAHYLIKTMITLASEKHSASTVVISCFSENTAGLLLYKKLGFEPFDIEERESPEGKRVALVRMRYKII